MHPDGLRKACCSGLVVEGDVKIPDGLGVMGVWFEGVVTREDVVKVYVPV